MLFNSAPFLLGFLPLALTGYFAVGHRGTRAALAWLVGVSLVFYACFDPRFVPLLLVSVICNYAAGRVLAATGTRPRRQRWTLRVAVAGNLAVLAYCKYLAWLIGLAVGTGLVQLDVPTIMLPVGISFFTFTQIGYLIDVRDGEPAARNPLSYTAFVALFPNLIAGPILRYGEMAPQFADPAIRRLSPDNLSVGLGIFVVGLLKKTLLADPTAAGLAEAFADPAGLPLFAAWHAALRYSLQLYFDFSGYSDMAIGLGRMLNLELPVNFDAPYRARSVIDYWQRWHMTLTRFLTRYLHDPLSLAIMRRRRARGLAVDRAAQKRLVGFATMHGVPVVVTIGLAGVWHGSGAQFLVFGLLHAGFLLVNRSWRLHRGVQPSPGAWGTAWRVALTYGCVLVASVFFRAYSVEAALAMLGGMAGLHGVGSALPITASWAAWLPGAAWLAHHGVISIGDGHAAIQVGRSVLWLVVLYAIVWLAPTTQQIFTHPPSARRSNEARAPSWLTWRPTLPWALALGGIGMLGLLSIGGTTEFLYFQF